MFSAAASGVCCERPGGDDDASNRWYSHRMIALASSMLGVPENPPPVKPPTNVFSVFFSDQMETWLLSATQMLSGLINEMGSAA